MACFQGVLVALAAAHVGGVHVGTNAQRQTGGVVAQLVSDQGSSASAQVVTNQAVQLGAAAGRLAALRQGGSAAVQLITGQGSSAAVQLVSDQAVELGAAGTVPALPLPGLRDLAVPISIVLVTVLLSAGIAISQRSDEDESYFICCRRRCEDALQEKRAAAPVPAREAPLAAPSPEEMRRMQAAISWLRLLVSTSLFLLALQAVLACAARSLTLIADSAHSGADVVTYSFALYVEWMKSIGRARTSPWVDVVSAMFSVTIVLGTAAVASLEAVGRLHGAQTTASDSLGLALVVFAVVSMAANAGVLAAHFRWYNTSAEERTTLDAPAPAATTTVCETVPNSTVLMSPKPQGANKWKWLHSAFHPGCAGGDCCEPGLSSASGSAQRPPATSPSMTESLNVYGALLHLGADVLRSVIVFVTGTLIATGGIADGAKADAVSALFVGACVVLGSLYLARAVIVKAKDAWQARSQSVPEAGNIA